MTILQKIKVWARRIKRDAVMLWFAPKHQDTPFGAKALCIFTVAYALSPVDLIPDFIPMLGYVDDAISLPALIWFAVRLLPLKVVLECRVKAEEWMSKKSKPKSYTGAVAIVLVWLALVFLSWLWFSKQS